jgi:hypothetical protein
MPKVDGLNVIEGIRSSMQAWGALLVNRESPETPLSSSLAYLKDQLPSLLKVTALSWYGPARGRSLGRGVRSARCPQRHLTAEQDQVPRVSLPSDHARRRPRSRYLGGRIVTSDIPSGVALLQCPDATGRAIAVLPGQQSARATRDPQARSWLALPTARCR